MIPEQRILMAVVNCAITDSCLRPIRRGRAKTKNPEDYRMQRDAHSAFVFLYGDGLDIYCNWLPFEASWLRKRLEEFMYSNAIRSKNEYLRITDQQKRAYRFNHTLWMKNPCLKVPEDKSNPLPIKRRWLSFDQIGRELDPTTELRQTNGTSPFPTINYGSKDSFGNSNDSPSDSDPTDQSTE